MRRFEVLLLEKNKILGMIGLSARARKVAFGADSVEMEIKKRKVRLVIVSNEASTRTKEKFKKLTDEYSVASIEFGEIDELSKAIGKSNKAVLGILDNNLAREIAKKYNGGEFIGKS